MHSFHNLPYYCYFFTIFSILHSTASVPDTSFLDFILQLVEGLGVARGEKKIEEKNVEKNS